MSAEPSSAEPSVEPGAASCPACGRPTGLPCRNTRDMEDANQPACRAALMMRGGGEYTANRLSAGKWHATLLMAALRARIAAPDESDVASVLAEMASWRLVEREGGDWRDLTPEADRPQIVEGLLAAGLAVADAAGAFHATPLGRDTVLGRIRDPWRAA